MNTFSLKPTGVNPRYKPFVQLASGVGVLSSLDVFDEEQALEQVQASYAKVCKAFKAYGCVVEGFPLGSSPRFQAKENVVYQ